MNESVPRIGPREAHQRLEGGRALLVCAYDDPQKFAKFHLEGALALDELRSREESLPRNQEIVFYCA